MIQKNATAYIKRLQLLLLQVVVCHQLSLSLFAPEASIAAEAGKAEQARQLIGQDVSIKFRTIFEHQAALEIECAKYHEEQKRQAQSMRAYIDDNRELGLSHLLPVKVPAVCLFLSSQQTLFDKTPASSPSKLDLVNWIYDLDEVQVASKQHRVAKRQVDQSPDFNIFPTSYLYNPLTLNLNSTNGANDWENELPLDEEHKKASEALGNMMADERFRDTIGTNKAEIAPYLSPVILVPGLLGSRLQARTDKRSGVNILCSKKTDWKDVWLSVRLLLPVVIDCWLDNVRLDYDPATGFSRAPAGVETRVANFGSVESVRNLDVKSPKLGAYFSTILDHYEKLGYEADKNLLAAPYDFRLAPQELTGYFQDLKQLVERAFRQQSANPANGKAKKVTLLCHSMGCTHLLVFLRSQSAAWRQSRIRKLIALSSPWAGAIKALKALVVGDQLELPGVSEMKMRALARTYPSLAFLLPQAEVFGRPNKNRAQANGPVLVQTPKRQYKVDQMPMLLRDLNLTKQLAWFEATASLIEPLKPLPDLQVDCIHGLNAPTPETLIFRQESSFPDGNYELVQGDGDGTVNFESLMVCQTWAEQLPNKVRHKIIMNTNHLGVLSNKKTLSHIMEDVMID